MVPLNYRRRRRRRPTWVTRFGNNPLALEIGLIRLTAGLVRRAEKMERGRRGFGNKVP